MLPDDVPAPPPAAVGVGAATVDDTVRVGVSVGDGVPLKVGTAVAVLQGLAEVLVEAEAPGLPLAAPEALAAGEGVAEAVTQDVLLCVGESVTARLGDTLGEGLAELMLTVASTVALREPVRHTVEEAECVGDTLGVEVAVGQPETVAQALLEGVRVGDWESVVLPLPVAAPEEEMLCVGDAVYVALGVMDSVYVPLAEGQGEREGEGEAVAHTVPEKLFVAEDVAVMVPLALAVPHAQGVAVSLGV